MTSEEDETYAPIVPEKKDGAHPLLKKTVVEGSRSRDEDDDIFEG